MALNTTNISYSGKEFGLEIVQEAIATNLITSDFGARVRNGVKDKGVWHNADISYTENAFAVSPTFNSNFTLNQNEVELCRAMAAGSIAHDALVNTYREMQLAQGITNEKTSDDTELFNALMEMLMKQARKTIGYNLLRNDATYDCNDGLIAQIQDSTLANPVPESQILTATSDITSASTVQATFSTLIDTLPEEFRFGADKKDLAMMVSYQAVDAYEKSLTYTAPTAAAGAGGVSPSTEFFRDVRIVPIHGLNANEAILTFPENIAVVYDDESDITNLIVRDGYDDSNLSAALYWRLNYAYGILFGDGKGIAAYL